MPHLKIKKLTNIILDFLFPIKCFGCGKKNIYLCADCAKNLPPISNWKKNILAATRYEPKVIKKAIWTLKYKKAKVIARPLAELIHSRVFSNLNHNYKSSTSIVMIPVPLYKTRLRQRGFNQAEEITKNLSDISGIPLLTNVLYKTRHTTAQVKMKDKEKRLENLKDAFSIKNAELIKDKIIYLIDDVSTTGATITECRKILLNSGAKEVVGLVVAR